MIPSGEDFVWSIWLIRYFEHGPNGSIQTIRFLILPIDPSIDLIWPRILSNQCFNLIDDRITCVPHLLLAKDVRQGRSYAILRGRSKAIISVTVSTQCSDHSIHSFAILLVMGSNAMFWSIYPINPSISRFHPINNICFHLINFIQSTWFIGFVLSVSSDDDSNQSMINSWECYPIFIQGNEKNWILLIQSIQSEIYPINVCSPSSPGNETIDSSDQF